MIEPGPGMRGILGEGSRTKKTTYVMVYQIYSKSSEACTVQLTLKGFEKGLG